MRDLVESSHDPTIRRHIAEVAEVWPATVLRYDLPAELPPWFRREKAVDSTRRYELRDVVIAPRTGLVTLPDGRILLESVGSLRRLTGWGAMLHDAVGPVERLDVRGHAVLPVFTGYYHWLFETLPASLAAAELPDARFVVPSPPPAVVMGALSRILGAEAGARTVVTGHRRVRVPAAAITTIPSASGFVRPEALELLRERFDPPSGGGRALYISRRLARNRALAGEDDLEAALRPHGVEIVHLERLDLDEQIALLAAAELVIAPHGAGLANLVWRSGPCRVVEIFAAGHHNDCYARLSGQLGFSYARVVAEAEPGAAGRVPVDAVLTAADLADVNRSRSELA